MLNASAIARLLRNWTAEPLRGLQVPEAGTINQTFLLKTPAGRYVLRAYRPVEREHVEREHHLVAYAQARGLPAPAPLPLLDGGTILERDGRFYALFPFISGRQVRREDLSASEIAAAGRFLALLHRTLRAYPLEMARQRTLTVGEHDRVTTLMALDRLEEIICLRKPLSESDEVILSHLRVRREWVKRADLGSAPGFSRLEQQIIHGDYQETNLFFSGSEVSGIIDWDQAYRAPYAWEVTRALHLMFQFEPAPSQQFLAAYREVLPLSLPDLEAAAVTYVAMRQ